jgi:hypothetical protein
LFKQNGLQRGAGENWDSAAERGLRLLKKSKPKPRKTHNLFKGAWYAGKESWRRRRRGSRSRRRNSFCFWVFEQVFG